MKKDTMKGRILTIISTLFMVLIFGLCLIMYQITKYAMYYHIGMASLLLGATSVLLLVLKRKLFKKFSGILKGIFVVLYLFLMLFGSQSIIVSLGMHGKGIFPSVSNVVIFLVLFVILLVLDKLCEYAHAESEFVDTMITNLRVFMKLIYVECVIATAVVVFESLKFFTIQAYVEYLFTAFLFYYLLCIFLSLVVIAIRKEYQSRPYINIPLPFSKKTNNHIGFFAYLEENTGLSMRSLWSVKYIRQIAPMVFFLTGVCLWLSTCIVQVEAYQQAAVYRFGKLKPDLLEPGIHLTLPYPIEKVEIYDTKAIEKITIGYRSQESTDNIWTTNHQGEEYKLLLGSGDEVVSINLRLEYKISDLFEYVNNSVTPETILEALSYELVTAQTIHTDLETLLSTDREAFSDTFIKELTVMLEEKHVGLEVVSVVLESIHPPKEIAKVYQETVSAEIKAEQLVLEAGMVANVSLAQAQTFYDEAVNIAKAEQSEKVAEAKSSVAEFMASLEAYETYGDQYTYQKYLNAIRKAYGNANLVIISKDIDESALFFGNYNGSNDTNDSNDSSDSNE